MIEPKPHSSFLPIMLLMVGLVVVAGVVLAIVPLVECEACAGVATLTYEDCQILEQMWDLPGPYADVLYFVRRCDWCQGQGETTLWLKASLDPTEDEEQLGSIYGKARLRELLA